MDRRHDAPLWRLSRGALPLGGGDAVLDPADAVQSRPARERQPGAYLTSAARISRMRGRCSRPQYRSPSGKRKLGTPNTPLASAASCTAFSSRTPPVAAKDE